MEHPSSDEDPPGETTACRRCSASLFTQRKRDAPNGGPAPPHIFLFSVSPYAGCIRNSNTNNARDIFIISKRVSFKNFR